MKFIDTDLIILYMRWSVLFIYTYFITKSTFLFCSPKYPTFKGFKNQMKIPLVFSLYNYLFCQVKKILKNKIFLRIIIKIFLQNMYISYLARKIQIT